MKLRNVAWAIVAVTVVLTIITIGLSVRNGTFSRDPSIILFVAMLASYAAVGAFVATRLPSNPIGWLLLLVGFGILVGGFASEYATYALLTSPGSLPFGRWAAWVGNWAFGSVTGVPLVLLLFPTGRVPSPRWRWMPPVVVACFALLTASAMLTPDTIEVTGELNVPNPLGIEALRDASSVLGWVVGLGLLGLSLASVLSVLVRFRRSSGDERQQVKWLAYAAALTGVMLVFVLLTLIGVPPDGSTTMNDVAFLLFITSLGVGIPVAVAVALLKYRLYDLDLVLKKTVLYATVAALLFVVFIAVALVAGALLGGSRTGVAIAAGTIGLLFWPAFRVSRRVADRIVYGGRATPYEILSGFSERLSETYATDDVLPRTAQLLAGATGAAKATVWLRIGGALRPAATWPQGEAPGETVSLHGDEMPWFPADWAEEVRDRGELLGALAVEMPANDPIGPTRQRLVRDLAAQAGLVLRNVRLIEELRESRRRIVDAQDERAKTLERNIHDGAQQQLVAVAVQLGLLEKTIAKDPEAARQHVVRLQHVANEALEDLRDLARGIYPPLLADEGLTAALEAQARKAAVPVAVQAKGIGRYSQQVESAVYFCSLEAVQNSAKYARASEVRIRLAGEDGRLVFEVADDGVGFDMNETRRGTGLHGMVDRIEAISGTLSVRTAPGEGTTVSGWVPVRPET